MKKFIPLLIWLGLGLAGALAVFVFVLQLQSNQKLNEELKAKKTELAEAQSASRKMQELEKKSQELKQEERRIKRRVAVNDSQPLELIKVVTGSASKIGLRNIGFELKTASAVAPKDNSPAASSAQGDPVPVYFQMKFDSAFSQAVKFIKELNELERIISLEKVQISRKKDIIPYQAVTLDLVTYFFQE